MAKKAIPVQTSGGELLVYVGPNIVNSPHDTLFTFQTFTAVPAYVDRRSEMFRLFVPLSRMAEARKELAVTGSRLFNAAKAVREQLAAKKREGK